MTPDEVLRVGGRRLKLSNPDKVLYPAAGFTKRDVVGYYQNPAGKFRALGATSPNKDGADKIDCIVDALKPLRLPTPGSYAAKVSFPL